MTEIVLRGILFSLLFVLGMKGMQYVAREKYGLVISNTMIAWMSFLVIVVAVFDGKLLSNTTRTVIYFAGMFVAFSLGALFQAAKKDREN